MTDSLKNKPPTTGTAFWTYDPEADAWYIGLSERRSPPYLKQIRVEAILDLDDDGMLAGVELVQLRAGDIIPKPRSGES